MRSPRAFLIACAAILALVLLPSQALAVSPVIADCNAHTKLTKHYSVSELRNALATMPADVKEYTSCYQTIQDQLYRQLGKTVPGSASGTSSGGSGISTPVLIVIIVIVVVGGGLAYAAWRRGGEGGDGEEPPAGPAG